MSGAWFVGAPVSFDGGIDEAALLAAGLVPTRPGDRHLTLAYLGPLPSDDARGCWEALPRLPLPAHTLAVGWEVFGARAVALTLADDGALVEAATRCLDVAGERLAELRRPAAFRPHVTLARARRRATPPTTTALRAWPVPPGLVRLGPTTLFRVRDAPTEDRYERVAHQQLPAQGA